jgi:heme exporter protein B
MLTTLRTVFYFELLLLWRRAQEWLYPLAFFVIVIAMFPFAFSPDPLLLQTLIPGGVWIAALFACILSAETMFHADMEEGSLEQWLLSSEPLAFLLLAKFTAHWLCTALPLILLTPVIGALLQLPAHAVMILTMSLLLGTPILTLLCSLGVTLTLGLRQQGVIMSLLILPLATPVLIFGVNMVLQTQSGFSAAGPLALLAGIFMLAVTGIPFAAAAALKIGLDD